MLGESTWHKTPPADIGHDAPGIRWINRLQALFLTQRTAAIAVHLDVFVISNLYLSIIINTFFIIVVVK